MSSLIRFLSTLLEIVSVSVDWMELPIDIKGGWETILNEDVTLNGAFSFISLI